MATPLSARVATVICGSHRQLTAIFKSENNRPVAPDTRKANIREVRRILLPLSLIFAVLVLPLYFSLMSLTCDVDASSPCRLVIERLTQ